MPRSKSIRANKNRSWRRNADKTSHHGVRNANRNADEETFLSFNDAINKSRGWSQAPPHHEEIVEDGSLRAHDSERCKVCEKRVDRNGQSKVVNVRWFENHRAEFREKMKTRKCDSFEEDQEEE